MNMMVKKGFAVTAMLASVMAFANDAGAEVAEDEGVVGWTPVAVSLASPVQLPWGRAKWDVFGLDLGLYYNDAPKMYGLQASLANVTRDDLAGLAVGGLCNYAEKDVYGMRAALGANICRETVYGVDIGGFGYHKNVKGLDAEIVATVQENVSGCAFSFICNYTKDTSYGCTIGGLNIADRAYGAQLAIVYNQAEELHGCQIGLVNYCRECKWGFQIGIVNIILDNQIKVLPLVNGYF